MTRLEASEAELGPIALGEDGEAEMGLDSALRTPHFESLEAFRPLPERAPEPQVAEAQRREFFAQLHRWLRQGYAVHVFCNNDGERQRFTEIWNEYGFAEGDRTGARPSSGAAASDPPNTLESSEPKLPADLAAPEVTRGCGTCSRGSASTCWRGGPG